MNLRYKGRRAWISLSKPCTIVNVHIHLWVSLDPGGLLTNACLVRLGIDHVQQVQGIVNTSSGEALDLLGFLAGLFRISGVKAAPSGEGARACGLGVFLFATFIGSSFLGWYIGLLLCEETGGFSLTGQLLLAFSLLVGILVLFGTVIPLGCLLAFL